MTSAGRNSASATSASIDEVLGAHLRLLAADAVEEAHPLEHGLMRISAKIDREPSRANAGRPLDDRRSEPRPVKPHRHRGSRDPGARDEDFELSA